MHGAVIIGMFPEYLMLRAGWGVGVSFPRPCPAPGLGGAKLGVFGGSSRSSNWEGLQTRLLWQELVSCLEGYSQQCTENCEVTGRPRGVDHAGVALEHCGAGHPASLTRWDPAKLTLLKSFLLFYCCRRRLKPPLPPMERTQTPITPVPLLPVNRSSDKYSFQLSLYAGTELTASSHLILQTTLLGIYDYLCCTEDQRSKLTSQVLRVRKWQSWDSNVELTDCRTLNF